MNLIKMNANDTGLNKKKCHVVDKSFFTLADEGNVADICISAKDFKGVAIAAKALTQDIKLVTGKLPILKKGTSNGQIVIAGTIGNNELIDALITNGKLKIDTINGKWETYVMETIEKPFEGADKALVIAGSDKRGTIYGIYKLSELIGVSAWVWWGDSVPNKSSQLLIADGRIETKEPSVRYRGIFINDENPCFGDWCFTKFNGVNSKMYVHVFELILRLKGNYMWPAMWGKSINIDDPKSPKLADEYGIVMGTSHHEPMMRAQKEWSVLGNEYGGHANWNYQRNKEGLYRFWEDRIRENKDYEKIVTVGMRGDGDESMINGGEIDKITAQYESIVSDQREILAKHINPDVTKVPQVWLLYKEMEDFYTAGMKVPDDIILALCDDNFGNVRHLPLGKMKDHKGGFGMYYHFDYVGGPFSYKWINNMPLQKTWEQMTMAYEYGVDKIWIVNVGDLKPMEFPIEYFLDLAYDIEKWGQRNKVDEYTYLWAKKEFGEEFAKDTAEVLSRYTKYNGRRKPENLFPEVYSVVNYNEADRVLAEYEEAANLAESIYAKLPKQKMSSFYQLVLYPTKASYLMYKLHICTAKNHLYAKQGRNSANRFARMVNDSFVQDWIITDYYNHKMSGGKWNGMMTQAHIGQTGWRSSEVNMVPELKLVTPVGGPKLFVAIPNCEEIYDNGAVDLFDFTSIGNEVQTITVGNGGDSPIWFKAEADQDWIQMKLKLNKEEQYATGYVQGSTYEDSVVDLRVDWSKVPASKTNATGNITINGEGKTVVVHVSAVRIEISHLPAKTFVDTQGVIAIEAEHYAENVALGGGEWKVINNYGRALSSMKVFPTNLESKTPRVDAPYLEYRFATKKTGMITVSVHGAPTNNLSAVTGMRYAIAIDEEKPQIIDTFSCTLPVGNGNEWDLGVMNNCRIFTTDHKLSKSDTHTLRIYMVDAGYVLQRLVIDCDEKLQQSFLGPQETYYIK
ncbi:MAG: glycosyl hydrolase 115 family protein [Mobilitalea sp.]